LFSGGDVLSGQFESWTGWWRLSGIISARFYVLISKFLTAACIFSNLLCISSVKAASEGYLEGHLKIIFSKAVESDDTPRAEIAPQSYAEYPLVILTQQGRREIKHLTTDAEGDYRVALPPGDYILEVQALDGEERTATHTHTTPQPFTIAPNQTVHVDMTVFAGFYKGQA